MTEMDNAGDLRAVVAQEISATNLKALHALILDGDLHDAARLCDQLLAQQEQMVAVEPWKDHRTAALVNELRDCAAKYGQTQQLRERIAYIVAPLCAQLKAAEHAAPVESVLIDGAAYDVPAEVAAELLRLHIELLQSSARPVEGVPAQAVQPVLGWIHKLRNGKIGSKFYTYEPHCDCAVRDDGGEKIAVVAATHPTQQGLDALTDAARSVIAERTRQISAEGYTPEKDDGYNPGVLALHGGLYACHAYDNLAKKRAPEGWQWDEKWWKPKDPRSNLVKAGALILAEIERMDRSFAAQAKQGGA